MRSIRILLALALLTTLAYAQTCPSSRAAKAGISPFETFHKIMHPAWHEAYPAKDFAALMKAAPEFEKAFEAIAALEAKTNNPTRKAAFLQHREEFAGLVKSFASAAKADDSQAVYEIMPELHEAFEMTASACMPRPYPEVEAIAITTHLILDKHLPADNAEGIVGSTETLQEKMKALTEKSLPSELQEKKAEILPLFADWTKLSARMKESLDKKDMAAYKTSAEELKGKVAGFCEKYL